MAFAIDISPDLEINAISETRLQLNEESYPKKMLQYKVATLAKALSFAQVRFLLPAIIQLLLLLRLASTTFPCRSSPVTKTTAVYFPSPQPRLLYAQIRIQNLNTLLGTRQGKTVTEMSNCSRAATSPSVQRFSDLRVLVHSNATPFLAPLLQQNFRMKWKTRVKQI